MPSPKSGISLKSKILNAVASITGRTRRKTKLVGPLGAVRVANEPRVRLDVAAKPDLKVAVARFDRVALAADGDRRRRSSPSRPPARARSRACARGSSAADRARQYARSTPPVLRAPRPRPPRSMADSTSDSRRSCCSVAARAAGSSGAASCARAAAPNQSHSPRSLLLRSNGGSSCAWSCPSHENPPVVRSD